MPKTKISEFSATAANNTDIDGINIAEGCPPSTINNAIRELMAQLKDQQAGTSGDNFTVGGNLTVTGTTTLGSALPISQGGTGNNTASTAINALVPDQTNNSGKYLTTNGVSVSWASASGTGGVTSVGLSTTVGGLSVTGSPVTTSGSFTLSGTVSVAGGGTGTTSLTSGNVLIGNGTSAINSVSPSTAGNVLTSNGSSWQSSGLPVASDTVAGIISTGNQTIAGSKTLASAFSASNTGNRIGPTANPSSAWPLFVGCLTADPALTCYSNASGGYAANFLFRDGASNPVIFQKTTSNFSSFTTCGSISGSTNAVAYNTSSDYRLKENIIPLTDAITKLKLLAPKRFTWKDSPSDGVIEGFIAHEVQEIVPNAVTGVKDAVDAKGNIIPQGMDSSFLVPLLTAALQEAIARIEALEARNV